MHTSGVTHPRWRSGQRWVSSCQHVQTIWPCNSEWCHESPQSSQMLLHYVKKTISLFDSPVHPSENIQNLCGQASYILDKCYLLIMRPKSALQDKSLIRINILLELKPNDKDYNILFRHVAAGATCKQGDIIITSALCGTRLRQLLKSHLPLWHGRLSLGFSHGQSGPSHL